MAGVHPLHFWGISLDALSNNLASVCQSAWTQYEWQASDGVSRDQVARSIRQAEDSIEQYLGYSLTPQWRNDRINLPDYYRAEFARWRSVGNRWNPFTAPWGRFIQAGARAKDIIEINAPITWATPPTEDPATNWPYTGTITIVGATFDDVNEIRVYYPDQSGNDLADIRPITVSYNSGTETLTITVSRQLCVKEPLFESVNVTTRPVRGEVAYNSNFISEVDVYRVYNDASNQGAIGWNMWNGCPSCTDNGCAACTSNAQQICVQAARPDHSSLIWGSATYSDAYGIYEFSDWCGLQAPEFISLNYQAGYPLQNGRMNPLLARAVMDLSMSMIERPPCGCITRRFEEAQKDLRQVAKGESYDLSPLYKSSPFGTKRGAVEAWRVISQYPRLARNSRTAFA
jgi:hypothetical protein